jgi:hypothetical protein
MNGIETTRFGFSTVDLLEAQRMLDPEEKAKELRNMFIATGPVLEATRCRLQEREDHLVHYRDRRRELERTSAGRGELNPYLVSCIHERVELFDASDASALAPAL